MQAFQCWSGRCIPCSSGASCYWVLLTHTHRKNSCCGSWWCIHFSVPAQRDNIWGPFLIISPASTLNNWHQEFTRFVPKFKVRISIAAEWAHQQKHAWRNPGVLISAALSGPLYFSNESRAVLFLWKMLSDIWEQSHQLLRDAKISTTIH